MIWKDWFRKRLTTSCWFNSHTIIINVVRTKTQTTRLNPIYGNFFSIYPHMCKVIPNFKIMTMTWHLIITNCMCKIFISTRITIDKIRSGVLIWSRTNDEPSSSWGIFLPLFWAIILSKKCYRWWWHELCLGSKQ